jgi:hypothetical protein
MKKEYGNHDRLNKTKDKIKTKNNLAEFYGFLVARQTKYLSTTKIYQSRKQPDSHKHSSISYD